MYLWMNWITSPKANAAGGRVVRRGAGQREGVRGRPRDRTTARSTTPTTRTYFDQVAFWTTPRTSCGDDRGTPARTTRTGSRPGRRSRADRLGRPRPGGGRPPAVGPVRRGSPASSSGTRGSSSACSCPAHGLAPGGLPRSLAVLFVASLWRLDDFTARSSTRRASELPDARRDARLPQDRACAR